MQISKEDLMRCGLLRPLPGERKPRRILRPSHSELCPRMPPPPAAHIWSGERGMALTIRVSARRRGARGRIYYCRKGDAWTSDPWLVYG